MNACCLRLIRMRCSSATPALVAATFAKEAGIRAEEVANLAAGARQRCLPCSERQCRLRQWVARFQNGAMHYQRSYLGWRQALNTYCLDTPVKMPLATVAFFPQG